MLEVIKATEQASGQAVPYEVVGSDTGDPVATFADPTFAESTLGWRAQYGLDEIIRTANEWHRSQLSSVGTAFRRPQPTVAPGSRRPVEPITSVIGTDRAGVR